LLLLIIVFSVDLKIPLERSRFLACLATLFGED